MPEISVVVPVYNAAAFLDECVRSILGQTFRDLELILVDDGSTDSSPALCDGFAAQDARVRVVHLPNGGVSAARNHGLELATGRFVQFVDSDDSILPQMLERMHAEAVEADCDLVVCGVRRIEDQHSKETVPESCRCASPDEFSAFAPRLARTSLLHHPVNKLISMRIVTETGALFPRGMSIGEDLLFCLSILRKCTRISCLEEAFYNYRIHGTATLSFRYHPDGLEAYDAHRRELASYFHAIHCDDAAQEQIQRRWIYDVYRHVALARIQNGAGFAGKLLDGIRHDGVSSELLRRNASRSLRAFALRSGSPTFVMFVFRIETALKAALKW